MNRDPEKGCLEPAALVRTEAAALEALATRLEGPMAAAFDRAVELILHCGEGNGRVVVTARRCFCIRLRPSMAIWAC